jgi:hypothetical protein
MRILSLIALAVSGFSVWLFRADFRPAHASEGRVPVLVELFTSEGCSSCPPADAFLEKLDRDQPISGADIVALSEHVDYWDELGWKDPFSSRMFTDRQAGYGQRFGLRTVYTPQMVVDGASEFVGNDSRLAEKAFSKAVSKAKIGIRFSSVSAETGLVRAHLETDSLPAELGLREGEVYLALALDHAETDVPRGENSGRKLTYTSVVRTLERVGTLRAGESFAKDVRFKVEPGADLRNLRLIAFVQEPGCGKVAGAVMQSFQQ